MLSKFDGCYRYLTYDDLAKSSLSAMTKKLNNQSLDLLCPTLCRNFNPIYTTEKIGKARMKIGKGNFHFRQGKGKMCSLHTSVLPLLVLF